MGSLADERRALDLEIFEEIGELMLVGSLEIPGMFFNQPRQVDSGEGAFIGVDVSFDCQITPAIVALVPDELVRIVARDDEGNERDLGTWALQARIPDKGDESGLVVLDLKYPP